ncbi:hypothetical protein SCA6_004092 [Theobroma cacao]
MADPVISIDKVKAFWHSQVHDEEKWALNMLFFFGGLSFDLVGLYYDFDHDSVFLKLDCYSIDLGNETKRRKERNGEEYEYFGFEEFNLLASIKGSQS